MTAQWHGITGAHASSVASLLFSELQRYYMDKYRFDKLWKCRTEIDLQNLDEFDKYVFTKIPL